MKTKTIYRITLLNGGATAPTVELYQTQSGHCRLYWYCYDQEEFITETIATFKEKIWTKAVDRAKQLFLEWKTDEKD